MLRRATTENAIAMPEPTLDPKAVGEQRSRPTALNHLKERLTFLASGCQTVQRLMSLAKGHLRTDWNELTFEQVDELSKWLDGRIRANRGGARIRWTIIRDVFVFQSEVD
jgi:hypothetical protein